MLNCLAVGLGGFFGSILRYLTGLIPLNSASNFPIKTLIINISGAFILSLVSALAAKYGSLSPRMILFLKVGLCGGFTTFSTFAYEASNLLKCSSGLGILYICLSLCLGILAIYFAEFLINP